MRPRQRAPAAVTERPRQCDVPGFLGRHVSEFWDTDTGVSPWIWPITPSTPCWSRAVRCGPSPLPPGRRSRGSTATSSCSEPAASRRSSPNGEGPRRPPASLLLGSKTRSWWRKHLDDAGFDAGARTIRYHLSQATVAVPALSTIHRVLRRRGFVTPQPQKRPRSSWIRFEARQPNECWQSDMTHWHLDADQGGDPQLHRRLLVGRALLQGCSSPRPPTWSALLRHRRHWGLPASVLTDNGAIYSAAYRGRPTGLEIDLAASGSASSTASPTIPRPRARSSATTRPSRSGCAKTSSDSRELQLGSTSSPTTTTRSGPTKRTAAHRWHA